MLYVIEDERQEPGIIYGVYEAPAGLDIAALSGQFCNLTSPGSYGEIAPHYDGPMIPYRYGPCSSGSLPEGTLVYDTLSPEYFQYVKNMQAALKAHEDHRQRRLAELRAIYPGEDGFLMFISYLEKEYGFRRVPSNVDRVGLSLIHI